MNIWLTADSHWGHENIIKFCNRPFSSVKEMNEALLSNWNETVKDNDTVYHLGDVAMGQFADSWSYVKKLHGMLYLVQGNHDRVSRRYHMSKKYYNKYRTLYVERFVDMGYEMRLRNMRLHHFPFEDIDHTGEVRFKEYRPEDDGRILIHGHIHELWQERGRQINVGVDVRGFRPVHLDEVLSIADRIVEEIPDTISPYQQL